MSRLKSHNNQRTVFVSPKGCSNTLFFSTLGTIALAGFVIHYFYPGMDQMPWAPIKFGCWAITAFFLIVIFITRGIQNAIPRTFIFDHEHGMVILETENTQEQAYIPYNEIEMLDIHVDERTSDDRTTKHYYGYLKKLDGSRWSFVSSVNEQTVREAIDLLRGEITPTRAFTPPQKTRISKKITKEENPETSLLYWTNRSAIRSVQLVVYTILYVGVFGFCLYVVIDFSGKFSSQEKVASLVFTGIFGVLLGWLLLRAIRRNLKNLFLRFALSVNKSFVEYFEFRKGSGERKSHISVAVDDIVAIRYGFQSWENYKKPLEIISRQHPETPVELYMDSLTPVECLQVENWLQETLEGKTQRKFRGV